MIQAPRDWRRRIAAARNVMDGYWLWLGGASLFLNPPFDRAAQKGHSRPTSLAFFNVARQTQPHSAKAFLVSGEPACQPNIPVGAVRLSAASKPSYPSALCLPMPTSLERLQTGHDQLPPKRTPTRSRRALRGIKVRKRLAGGWLQLIVPYSQGIGWHASTLHFIQSVGWKN